jgi:hypothetical protein
MITLEPDWRLKRCKRIQCKPKTYLHLYEGDKGYHQLRSGWISLGPYVRWSALEYWLCTSSTKDPVNVSVTISKIPSPHEFERSVWETALKTEHAKGNVSLVTYDSSEPRDIYRKINSAQDFQTYIKKQLELIISTYSKIHSSPQNK